jgi:hypothetical protein
MSFYPQSRSKRLFPWQTSMLCDCLRRRGCDIARGYGRLDVEVALDSFQIPEAIVANHSSIIQVRGPLGRDADVVAWAASLKLFGLGQQCQSYELSVYYHGPVR